MEIQIIRGGSRIVVTGAGGLPLPPMLKSRLEDYLQYEHIYQKHGQFHKVEKKLVYLHWYDRSGRFTCSPGWESRISATAASIGHQVRVLAPRRAFPHPRPNRHDVDWERGLAALGEVRPDQPEVLRAIAEAPHGRGTIVAPPGIGKSRIIRAAAAAYKNAQIHVVAPSKQLVQQLHDDISEVIPRVGMVCGGCKRFGRVTVVSADSLSHVCYDSEDSDRYADIVLGDEGHLLVSQRRSEWMSLYRDDVRLFLFTASPTGRSDGSDKLLEAIGGPIIYRISYQHSVESGLVVPIIVDWLLIDSELDVSEISNPVAKLRHGIWRHAARNQAFARRVREFDSDTSVLMLVETIEHGAHLKGLLPEYTLLYDTLSSTRYDRYVRQNLLSSTADPPMTKELLRTHMANLRSGKLKKVIALRTLLGTGVDAPHLAVVVRVDALNSEIASVQLPGRSSRLYDGKKYGLVIDGIDVWDASFQRRSENRSRVYKKQGWQQLNWEARAAYRKKLPKYTDQPMLPGLED